MGDNKMTDLKWISIIKVLKLGTVLVISVIIWFSILLPLTTAIVGQMCLWIFSQPSLFIIYTSNAIAAGLSGMMMAMIVSYFFFGKEIVMALLSAGIAICIFVIMIGFSISRLDSPQKDYRLLEISAGIVLLIIFSLLGAKLIIRIRKIK
jgi:hypothetical protein